MIFQSGTNSQIFHFYFFLLDKFQKIKKNAAMFFLCCFAHLLSFVSISQTNPFAETKSFAVITEEDCSIMGGYVTGAIAAGRNFSFSNTSIATSKTSLLAAPGEIDRKTGLWVGGTISSNSSGELFLGQNTVVRVVNRGLWNCNTTGAQTRITYNGGFNTYPRIVLNGQPADCGSITNTGIFSVPEIFSYLKSFGSCAENATVNTVLNGTEIVLSSANTIHYCELSKQQIESGQTWTVRGAEQSKPLVIRVNGGGNSFVLNSNFNLNTDKNQHIFFYFYNMPELYLDNPGNDFDASILAPSTRVIKNNTRKIRGQVIAKSFVQNEGIVDVVPFDASLPLTAFVGNYVWKDANANGVQDAGERGVPNIAVALYDPVDDIIGNQNDVLKANTGTDYNGFYSFNNVTVAPCGSKFYLRFAGLPAGNTFTRALTGGTDVVNNSKVTSSGGGAGFTNIFLLKQGESNYDMDAGISGPDISTLPLHTLTVSARLSGINVQLDWIAENELNTRKFIVQRSFDGILFTDINERAVTGIANVHTQYSFMDDISGLNTAKTIFYRIMAMDDVNRYAYSNVVSVKQFAEKSIKVWPVPFDDKFTVHFLSTAMTKMNISLFDITGKERYSTVSKVYEGANQFQISGLSGLSNGTYLLKVTDMNTGAVQMQKLVK